MRSPDTVATTSDGRLLVPDDAEFVAKSITRELHEMGYPAAAIAFLEREALRMVVERSPDLVLMDIRLRAGVDSGIEVVAAMRRG